MTAGEALQQAVARLRMAGVENASADAGWLLAEVLGISRSVLLAQRERLLSEEQAALYGSLVDRRARREPLQYLLGTQPFAGLELRVTPAVLIPRPETEELVAEVLRRLQGPVYLADVCTGSGAIALALAAALPSARVWATDLSAAALAVARENAVCHGLQARVQLAEGDLLTPLLAARTPEGQPLLGQLAALVCNPPYVPDEDLPGLMPEVREWEPHMALVTGTGDPLHFYRRLAAEAQPFLRPGGFLALEVGAGQGDEVAELLRRSGWQAVTVLADSQGIGRMVLGDRA